MRAILAGMGALPGLLLQADDARVVGFQGVPVDVPIDIPARFEQLGTLFEALRADGVTEVCLAGAMSRPPLDPVAFDPLTASKMPRLMAAMGKGDDALLRAVIGVIEEAGFTVIAAHEIRDDLVAEPGVLAGRQMSVSDANRARTVLDALGTLDVCQAAVAAKGQIIGIETLQGTDAMLAFIERTMPASGGVLVKRPKSGQDLRVDMPSIGVDTVRNAARAGLKGIEVAPGEVMLLDQPAILKACAQTGMNLWAGP